MKQHCSQDRDLGLRKKRRKAESHDIEQSNSSEREHNMKLIISTCTKEESEDLVTTLLKEKLVACANIVNDVCSKYWWDGKIETSKESLLIMKTNDKLVESLIEKIKELHSYDVPEIIVIDIVQGNSDYFNWINKVVN